MMSEIESYEVKMHNIFPLRSEIIPKHIRLDTTTLVNLLLRPCHGTKMSFVTKGNLKKREDEIWKLFFNTK